MNTPFEYTHTMEPHHRRRLHILEQHPELRTLSGFDRSTIAITFAVVAVQLGIAYALGATNAPAWQIILAAFAIGAVLNHWAGQTIHETAHNLAARTPAANRALALFANVPLLFPIAATFHRYHLAHHRFLGVEGRDTDLPHPLEIRVIGNSAWRKALWLLSYFFVYSLRALTFLERPNRAEVLNWVLQLSVNVLLAQYIGSEGMWYLAASTIIGHSIHPVAAHFIHEHYVFAPGQETFSYYGPLNWLSFNVGYHVEHHDFMSVPGSRLPALYAIASAHYKFLVSHRSWSWVLWHFVVSKTMSVGSRLVRTESDFAKARREGARNQPMPAWSR